MEMAGAVAASLPQCNGFRVDPLPRRGGQTRFWWSGHTPLAFRCRAAIARNPLDKGHDNYKRRRIADMRRRRQRTLEPATKPLTETARSDRRARASPARDGGRAT